MGSSEEMAAFARVADKGSFADAAMDLGLTPSALSKLVTRLEDRLGVRLMTRTTRRLTLTPEGEAFLTRTRDVLALIEAAESEAAVSRRRPKGHLRVNTGTAFAKHHLVRMLPMFLAAYPEITLELGITDRQIDPVAEQVDVAFRAGILHESSLIARKLMDGRRKICASPAYLAAHGTPKLPADLLKHNCMIIQGFSRLTVWPFQAGDGINRLEVRGDFACDSADVLYDMALAGHGIVRLSDFLVGGALADGRLVELFPDLHAPEPVPLWAVMPPGRHRAPRVQVFVEFVARSLEQRG
jgi:DNA-binding transcriptional LysR family regulator